MCYSSQIQRLFVRVSHLSQVDLINSESQRSSKYAAGDDDNNVKFTLDLKFSQIFIDVSKSNDANHLEDQVRIIYLEVSNYQ